MVYLSSSESIRQKPHFLRLLWKWSLNSYRTNKCKYATLLLPSICLVLVQGPLFDTSITTCFVQGVFRGDFGFLHVISESVKPVFLWSTKVVFLSDLNVGLSSPLTGHCCGLRGQYHQRRSFTHLSDGGYSHGFHLSSFMMWLHRVRLSDCCSIYISRTSTQVQASGTELSLEQMSRSRYLNGVNLLRSCPSTRMVPSVCGLHSMFSVFLMFSHSPYSSSQVSDARWRAWGLDIPPLRISMQRIKSRGKTADPHWTLTRMVKGGEVQQG